MKKMRKIAIVLAVIAVLALALTACAQQPSDNNAEQQPSQDTAVPEKSGIAKVYDKISEYFDVIVQYLILLVEFIGIVILVYAIISAVIGLFRRQKHVRLKLAEGIALSLEFKMGGELLRTVIVREWNELLILGAIILLRAALTFLIQWEIKIERKSGAMSDLELHDIKTPLTQDLPRKNAKSAKSANADESENK